MEDNKQIQNQDNFEETIKIIKEEYEKKIAEMQQQHEEELNKVREEEHRKNVETIRALMSGKQVEISEKPAPQQEISFEEKLIEDTRKNLGL